MAGLFTKIINGELPSYKVYEDEFTYAFLDINPVKLGHTLVVPKCEVDYFVDVEEPYYSAVFKTAKIISPAIKKATKCERVGGAAVGFEVPHFHYHLVPLWDMYDLNFANRISVKDDELPNMLKEILSHL